MTPNWDALLLHKFDAVSIGKTTCKSCNRQESDSLHKGEVIPDLEYVRVEYFDAERVQGTLLAQMNNLGVNVNLESLAIKRIELLLEYILESLATYEDRIKLETDIRKQICLILEDAVVKMRMQRLAVPNSNSGIIIPGSGMRPNL
jgi:hypothetical protein